MRALRRRGRRRWRRRCARRRGRRRRRARAGVGGRRGCEGGRQGGGVGVDEGVPAALDGLDPFRAVAQRDARRAEDVGLLLHAAGVGDDGAGVAGQRQGVEVTDGLGEDDVVAEPAVQPLGLDGQPRARVQSDEDRLVECRQRAQDRGQPPRRVGVDRPVDGRVDEAAALQAEAGQRGRFRRQA